ncbi:hypothetical protein SAMN02745133_02227 [Desulforamulus putei DSM 12395]|uniref:DUF192 domain-containing protein n=1 Tax=Desulforamulus putei DSM 12395 TaxID=1121429 RepID=A0A1M5A9F6_9FIRM|nr:DUF192 domain-containing protein [Desulforamulus putei]SHF26923.1 hypothetical protein SAMN02745133_02227 [Desulforamulus putei DSM 12395]
MTLISSTISQIAFDRVIIANTFFTRLRGLLGRSEMPKNTALILTPCRQVHTFFMQFPVGVIFLDKQGVVLHKEVLKPWRISKYIKDAVMVVEVAPSAVGEINVGDVLYWQGREE